jgi:hypothetical protein
MASIFLKDTGGHHLKPPLSGGGCRQFVSSPAAGSVDEVRARLQVEVIAFASTA